MSQTFLLSDSVMGVLRWSLPSHVPAVSFFGVSWAFLPPAGWSGQRSCVRAVRNPSSKGSNGPILASAPCVALSLCPDSRQKSKLPFLCPSTRADLFQRCQGKGCASRHGNSTELTSFLLGNPQVCHKNSQTLGGGRNLLLD